MVGGSVSERWSSATDRKPERLPWPEAEGKVRIA